MPFAPWTAAFILPALAQAYLLLQHPKSKVAAAVRIALIPPSVWLSVAWSTNYFEPRPLWTNVHFFLFTIAGCFFIFRSFEWAFCDPDDYTWTGPPISATEHLFQTFTSMRGIHFKWGSPKSKLPAPHPRDVRGFVKANLKLQMKLYGLTLLALPMARIPGYTWQAPPWPQPDHPWLLFAAYVLQTWMFGLVGYAGLELGFQNGALFACVAQTALHKRGWVARRFDSTEYPPLGRWPWGLESVKDFWGHKWHRMITRTFIMLGLRPLRAAASPVLGQTAGVAVGAVGAYAISGLLHEYGTHMATPYLGFHPQLPPWPSMIFFISQGVVMCFETAFKQITGIKIRGWPGWIWALLATGIPGTIMVEDWLGRGLICDPISIALGSKEPLFWPTLLRLLGKT